MKILLETHQIPEANLFCRTYLPSKLNETLEIWNNSLAENYNNSRMSKFKLFFQILRCKNSKSFRKLR